MTIDSKKPQILLVTFTRHQMSPEQISGLPPHDGEILDMSAAAAADLSQLGDVAEVWGEIRHHATQRGANVVIIAGVFPVMFRHWFQSRVQFHHNCPVYRRTDYDVTLVESLNRTRPVEGGPPKFQFGGWYETARGTIVVPDDDWFLG